MTTVRTLEVFSNDVQADPDGGRVFVLRGEFIEFLERTGPPELRLDWGGGMVEDVGWLQLQADGTRLADGAIGWPVPAGAIV